MKTKAQKRNEARKNAEAVKAARKAIRQSKGNAMMSNDNGRKGKSVVPQSKSRAKR